MSEEMIPDVMVQASDVPETAAAQAPEVAAAPVETAEETVNYADKSLAELVELFQGLAQDEDRMKKAKEAEAIKSAFYRKLLIPVLKNFQQRCRTLRREAKNLLKQQFRA